MSGKYEENKENAASFLGILLNLFSREEVYCVYINPDDPDEAIIQFENGYEKKVGIACDSVVAMCMDICKALL